MFEDEPIYVQGAQFLRPEQELEPEMWPREPDVYDPSSKFTSRYMELRGAIEGKDIRDAISYGEMYPAARGCVAFISDLGGVALYVIVTADIRGDTDTETRPDIDKFPDLTPSDMDYKAITIWPYVYNRDSAWGTGRWTGSQLDLIESIQPDDF